MNKREFIKSGFLFVIAPNLFIPKFGEINWVSHQRNARNIYVRRSKMHTSEYSFPWSVAAIDTYDKCGFTPQDWNFTWVPNNNYREVTLSQFKKECKKLKTVTTHFLNP